MSGTRLSIRGVLPGLQAGSLAALSLHQRIQQEVAAGRGRFVPHVPQSEQLVMTRDEIAAQHWLCCQAPLFGSDIAIVAFSRAKEGLGITSAWSGIFSIGKMMQIENFLRGFSATKPTEPGFMFAGLGISPGELTPHQEILLDKLQKLGYPFAFDDSTGQIIDPGKHTVSDIGGEGWGRRVAFYLGSISDKLVSIRVRRLPGGEVAVSSVLLAADGAALPAMHYSSTGRIEPAAPKKIELATQIKLLAGALIHTEGNTLSGLRNEINLLLMNQEDADTALGLTFAAQRPMLELRIKACLNLLRGLDDFISADSSEETLFKALLLKDRNVFTRVMGCLIASEKRELIAAFRHAFTGILRPIAQQLEILAGQLEARNPSVNASTFEEFKTAHNGFKEALGSLYRG